MREKVVSQVTVIMLTFLIPYCITMLTIGVQDASYQTEGSGILIEKEDGSSVDLEEYIKGVTALEISTEEEQAAINAQMIIARTNLMREIGENTEIKERELSEKAVDDKLLRENLGSKKYNQVKKKLGQAQKETNALVLTYDGKYIEALYHVCDTGMTASAKEITGKDKAYLQSEESSEDIESEDYMNVKEFSKEQVLSKIKTKLEGETLKADNILEEIHIKKKTALGYVQKIEIGEESMTGEEWESLFGLSSANFYIEEYQGKVRMISLGKGHGMGLSQYGANKMAEDGKTYKEILLHYYRDVKITKMK